jgi:uncharacterized protein
MNPPPQVFLRRVLADQQPSGWPDAVQQLLDASKPFGFVKRNDLAAIKVHVGEPGVTTYLPPEVSGVVARALRDAKARPFFTDTAVLYTGPRSHGVGHAEVAAKHGFTLDRAGAVFVPADGIEGDQEVEVAIPGRHFKKIGVAQAIAAADCLVAVSHATGHLASGLAATLKNLGMGCASRKGKLLQHSDTKPFVKRGSCAACGECIDSCPSDALSADADSKAVMDESKCIGCAECIAQCRSDAIGFRWDASSQGLQEKMAEHALGVVTAIGGRSTYVLGIVNLTRDCDCLAGRASRVAPDVGFALSSDPVALDQAAMDLICASTGKRLDQLTYPALDGTIQLAYAEQIGLGKREYCIVEV